MAHMSRAYARQSLVCRGLLPFLAAPSPNGEQLLEDAIRSAARLGLVAVGGCPAVDLLKLPKCFSLVHSGVTAQQLLRLETTSLWCSVCTKTSASRSSPSTIRARYNFAMIRAEVIFLYHLLLCECRASCAATAASHTDSVASRLTEATLLNLR